MIRAARRRRLDDSDIRMLFIGLAETVADDPRSQADNEFSRFVLKSTISEKEAFLYTLGRVFSSRQRWLDASVELQHAVRLNAGPSALVLDHCMLGDAYQQLGQLNAAEKEFLQADQMCATSEEHCQSLWHLANVYGVLLHQSDRATQLLQKALTVLR